MRDVLPYLVAPKDAVEHGGWSLRQAGEWVELPDALADWDYNTDVELRAAVRVDLDAVFAATGLDPASPLRWVVSWRAVDGKVGATALVADVPAHSNAEAALLEVKLSGQELGPVVDIRTRVELVETRPSETPGVATLAGSVLWEHIHTVALAGDLARFPVASVDFAASGLDPDASWVLDIPADLTTPVLGGLLLLLNERDRELLAAVDREPDGHLALQLGEDVAVALLDHAVVVADELTAETWDDDSLGMTLLSLANRAEGGLSALVGLRDSRPAAYRAVLVGQARRSGLGRRFS